MNHPASLRLRFTPLLLALLGLGLFTASADSVLTTVTVGSSPNNATADPGTNIIYVTNLASGTVTEIDGENNTAGVFQNPAVGSNPTAIAVNGVTHQVYVANQGSNNVTVLDGTVFNSVAATVNVGTAPVAIAVNPVTNTIYVANYSSNNVSVIDGTNNTVTATVGTGSGSNPGAVAVNVVTNQIYVANFATGKVKVIDGASNTVVATVTVGTNPNAVAVNPVTNQIYVANSGSGNVTVIDGPSNTVAATVSVGTTPLALAVNPVTNQIYVANNGSANVTVIDGASNTPSTVSAGTNPAVVSVNSATNKIYVANAGSANVTVIDGATNAAATVAVGGHPAAVAVNPVTNEIYVANEGDGNVSVIDGEDNATTTVSTGASSEANPAAVAVNPVTNQIYVTNNASNIVTVIDGTSNGATPVSVGSAPAAVAVNPVTNQIYVANSESSIVSVIDGSTNAVSPVTVGLAPVHVVVNPVTNRIYVVNANGNSVSVIDGATNTVTATVAVGVNPSMVAVNVETNTIYVLNTGGQSVTVINGATNTVTATVSVGSGPLGLAVNPATGKIYVANTGGTKVTVINGATNTVITAVTVGSEPYAVAVNPATNQIYVSLLGGNVAVLSGTTDTVLTTVTVPGSPYGLAVNAATNKIYVANQEFSNVTVIDGATYATSKVAAESNTTQIAVNPVTNQIYASVSSTFDVPGANAVLIISPAAPAPTGLVTAITPFAGNVTLSDSPIVSFQATSLYGPTAPPVQQIFFQVDTMSEVWNEVAAVNGSASMNTYISRGPHTLYAYAIDGQESTSGNAAGSPIIGRVSAYYFIYGDTPPVATAQSVTVERGAGQAITLSGSGGPPLFYDVLTQPANGVLSGTAPNLTYTASTTYSGSDSFTFLVSDGASASAPATVSITIVDSPPVAVNDVYYMASSSLSSLTLPVLANDSDPEGRSLTITAVSNAGEGRVTVAPGGQSLIYQPEVSFATSGRADKFTYTISNGDQTATAQVDVFNPYYHHQGNFDALLTGGTTDAGYLTLKLGGAGSFTGTLKLDGVASVLRGVFASDGSYSVVISRKLPLLPATLDLQFDQATGTTITASITDDSVSYAGTLEPQVAIDPLDPVGQAGSYTVMIFPPTPLTGNAATATATVVNGALSGFTLTSNGSGYVTAPLVTISGAGSGAAALATVASGKVTGLTLIKPGSKYGTSAVTVTINPPADSLPGGTGWGLVTVTAAGVVTLTGELGDGTPFSCSTFLSSNATFPIYVALNPTGSLGSLSGVATFSEVANVRDFYATLTWNKAPQSKPGLYQAGFSTQVTLLGSYYTPVKEAQALAFSSASNPTATVDLTGANLTASLQDSVSVSTTNVVKELGAGTDHLKLTINGARGLITGSFLSSAKGTSVITGVVFQKQNLAAGLFTTPTLTGNFTLDPQ